MAKSLKRYRETLGREERERKRVCNKTGDDSCTRSVRIGISNIVESVGQGYACKG